MGVIDRILTIIEDYFALKQTEIIPPFLVTVTTTAKSIMQVTTQPTKAFYVGIELRSIGTASYVEMGPPGHLNSRLYTDKSYQEFESPKNRYIDASQIYVRSDSNDAVIEVSGVFMDA